ncbi:SLAM family member 5-like isoform X2 [Pleurodeles waltl]|uniref:SLAM family member 5-like isoform X2 n=1 Tax=Pleurodeles waltl TaxID=8319 RepID=UPI003709538B
MERGQCTANSIERNMLCCFIHLFTFWVSAQGNELPMELNKVADESVTFPMEISNDVHINSVLWTVVQSKTILAILKPDESPKMPNKYYKERLSVPPGSYSLQIHDLKQEDSGSYGVKIYTDASPIQKYFQLQVFPRLQEPDIEVLTKYPFVDGTCNLKLSCIVKDGGNLVRYSWKDCGGHSKSSAQSVLDLTLTARDNGLTCTCEVHNPVSQNSKTVTPWHLCKSTSAVNAGINSFAVCQGIFRSIISLFIMWFIFLNI